IDRMLAKSPKDRPEDGRAVAAALSALGDLPAAVVAEPPRVGKPRKALTTSEQRAMAVILIGPPRVEGNRADPPTIAQTIDAYVDRDLREAARAHGGVFERLMDGSAAVMLSSTVMATDLAAQAARCALALRPHAPGRFLVLAMGRSEQTGRLPMGHAF